MSDLVEKAKLFATAAHGAVGQRRKYTDDPYINHPASVAELVESIGGTPEQIAAAWLHDCVEDTWISIEDIEKHFGSEVAELVGWLTDVAAPEDGNRAQRKEIERQHSAQAPMAAKTIKLADVIDNTSSIVKHDPHFSRIYLGEIEALLEVIWQGHPALYERARWQVLNGQRMLDRMFKLAKRA